LNSHESKRVKTSDNGGSDWEVMKTPLVTHRRRDGIRFGRIILTILGAALLQGCYPACETFNQSAVYAGRLLDAESTLPVKSANVTIELSSFRASAKSIADGSFQVGPLREFRVGVMTLEGLRPGRTYGLWTNVNVNISRPGYQPLQLFVPTDPGIYFDMGVIKLLPEHKSPN
jgi:hypothetical protein